MPSALRVCLTLSGGASLGAYEAGASAALLAALECVRDEHDVDVRVDAVGGASAGAIVGLMVAYSLLEGVDGPSVLHDAWVERVSIDALLRRGARGPLSLEGVRQDLPELLEGGGRGTAQRHPLTLHVALTGLRGLTYDIHGLRGKEPATGVTYADWKDFRLEPGGGIEQLARPKGSSPLETVLASASHPGAFAPRVLDRRRDTDEYRRQGISNLPRSGWLWYSDGGLVQSEPLGRVLAAARAVDHGRPEDAHRLTLLVDPRSEEPSDAEEWSDHDYHATWAHGLSRALALLPKQAVYDDLRRIERDNYRLDWVAQLVESVGPHLGDPARDDLAGLLERIAEDRRGLRGGGPSEAADLPSGESGVGELLRRAVEDIGGLTGKQRVAVDVISPMLLAERDRGGVADLLAGELLGDFGGFLDRDLRRSDFALGYESTRAWCGEGLGRCDLPNKAVEAAVAAIDRRRPGSWNDVGRGQTRHRDLSWRARLRLARFLLRAGRALLR
ncbi:MAG: patatin-like phospholipase family protein [Thermoleophilaceae bacterium]|nr:patatin-like phospholipase family protein [Thermoleophilaceae bacterium]